MKKRNFGFTLIELLVVIVIIGILATISTATFKSYFGKARDAERQSAVQNIALMIKVDGADDWKDTKYIYDEVTDAYPDLSDLMESNDFRVPDGKNNICYFIGMAKAGEGQQGDSNEFVVATWGESTSTEETGTAGILADGTQGAIASLQAALVVADFSCDSEDMGEVMEDFTAAMTGLAPTALFINELGVIVNEAAFPTS